MGVKPKFCAKAINENRFDAPERGSLKRTLHLPCLNIVNVQYHTIKPAPLTLAVADPNPSSDEKTKISTTALGMEV